MVGSGSISGSGSGEEIVPTGKSKGLITWAGLARSAEMTALPSMWLNLEAVVWKGGYLKENESYDFTFANPLFRCIIFSFM